jgi:phosphatidylglycerol:prolipoprotein diacylglycerol transferase
MVSVLPTQLFEAAALLALFAVLFAVYRKYRRYTTGIYLIGYAVIRFGNEYLRGDPRAAVGPFSISQTISLVMMAVGAWFVYLSARSARGAAGCNG